MRNERNSLRQAAITAGILAALGVCTLGGDQPRVWAAESSNNTAQAEAKTAAVQGVQAAADETENEGVVRGIGVCSFALGEPPSPFIH